MSVVLTREQLEATRAFYDRISRAYDLLADAAEHEAREKGLELLAPAEGERILEVGYGTGAALVDLGRAVGRRGTVCGIDLSPGMRDVARARVRKAGLARRVALDVGSVPPLPYDDAAFDAAFLSLTLELFPPEVIPKVLGELRRVLLPGGRLGLVCMAEQADSPHSLAERAYRWMHRHFPHIVDCRPIDVDGVLERGGFRVARVERLEIWKLPVRAVLATP